MFGIITELFEIITTWYTYLVLSGMLPLAWMIALAIAAEAAFDADYCDAMSGYDARHFARDRR